MLNVCRPSKLGVISLFTIFLVACSSDEGISETPPPTSGFVTARISSSFGVDDQDLGITLPEGLQLFVTDSVLQPIGDATVSVYPGGGDPIAMVHQGGGRYEFDLLSGRIEPTDDEYFFEVQSLLLLPERVVLRAMHAPLQERPVITAPTERSEHDRGEDLVIRWEPVAEADCYNISTREHPLQAWTLRLECLTDTVALIPAEEVHDFSYVRVRAIREVGDESYETAPYYSRSVSDAEVRIYLITPTEE